MRIPSRFAVILVSLLLTSQICQAQRRPAPPESRYGYTFEIDKKTLPKGVNVRTVRDGLTERHFLKNESDIPLVINEKFHLKRLIAGTKLVSGQVFQYFPNGVPMEGKRHLKGWQSPFGVIKETHLRLPKDPMKIYEGRKPGLPKTLPRAETATIDAKYDGKPHAIKVTIRYHLNPAYGTKGGNNRKPPIKLQRRSR